jgi:hypothetical protein
MDATRHPSHVQALERAILETPGATTHEQRVASAAGRHSGDATEEYLAKVRTASYRIVDDDLDRLKRGGLSEDAIFELTLAAAFGEAARRLDDAVAALRRAASADRAP